MVYKVLADTVVLTHFLWIIFLILGWVWGRKHRVIKYVHILGLCFAFVINVFGLYCPLTDLEVWLQSRYAPGTAYTGSFIAHYLDKAIYIDLPMYVISLLTVFLCAFNVWVYLRKRPPVSPHPR